MAGISVHYDCLVQAKKKLLAKLFPGLPNDGIVIRTLPRVDEAIDGLPVICIALYGAEEEVGTLTATDDIAYPVPIVIIAASNHDFTANAERYLGWRQTIYRAMRNQRIEGVESVITVRSRPDVVVDPMLFNMNYHYSGILFQCVSREGRG